jgi:hypothetical protein
MNEKKYLVYVDILGFEALAREIAEKTGFEEDVIRQNYLSDPLEKEIEEIKREGIQISKGISEIEGSDNYVLIVDHIQTAFELVGKLTTIRIPHKAYKCIPLEVGLGTKEIDEDIEVKPINRKEIIRFLKSDIINPYRSYYKKKHGKGIKETFVLFTQDFFDALEPLDRKYCEQISYKTKTFFVADVDKVQQRGSVFEFLEKIGYAGSKWYGRIDEVYVPPLEYEDMKRTLKEKRFVFITGTQEYGKTYTAVRLMWEYYNSGYEPGWIKGGEVTERVEVRRRLENISAELKPRHIVYFEDPFGRTRYEGREGLEREIGTIIDTVKQVEDVYVIITSREEIFKKFEKENLSVKELKEFEKKLNIKKPSYGYKKRKEILLNWAEEENCRWLGNKELKKLILGSIEDEKILPTPLSIKDFAVASTDIEKEDELREKIEEKSKETAKALAEEIENMSDDKILFLSFPFISSFEVEFVRATYQELVKELNLRDAWGFNRVLNWFKDDKINISDKHIQFSHPSYSTALRYLLVEDGDFTRINREIFSKLLLKLSENDEAAEDVALTVTATFKKLPEDVRNKLLLKLSENDEVAGYVAWAVARDFGKLPENVRYLLFKLLEKDADNAFYAATSVIEDCDKLPEDVRNKLLLKFSENDKAAGWVAWAVASNFDKLPEDVRNLLFKLSEKDVFALDVTHAVIEYFDKLPDDFRNKLLFKLSENDKAAGYVAWAVARNFEKLPEDVRNLLDRLPLQEQIEVFSRGRVTQQWHKEEALHLISNALPKLNRDFVLKILNELSECKHETVRIKAAKMLKDIFDDSKGGKKEY